MARLLLPFRMQLPIAINIGRSEKHQLSHLMQFACEPKKSQRQSGVV
jgi:hypothetical protein